MQPDPSWPPAARELDARARRETTDAEGATLVWRCWGEGHPVVLLHGGSGSWMHWLRNIQPLLDASRAVWAVDLPGFGESGKVPGCEDADHSVAPVASGLRELAGGHPVDLVAFSFGSVVGGLLAAAEPALVRRLVAVGSPIQPLANPRGAEIRPWKHLADPAEREAVHRANLAALMLHKPESIDADALALHAWNVARDRMLRRRIVRTDALRRALATVQVPLWAIYGEEDVLMRDQWPQVRATWEALPALQAFTTIPGAGHWVQYEAADRFNAVLGQALGA